ncbi:TonB-dependent receptor plug domain-containing protein [Asaia astilbis]|uniref:TonB-dependent receptor plug domain-containing protein n=1 Tax=Asaia astilbis TaxID=610244 RepID=UPI001E658C08|nr:TonB-dependent receptor plug domain-containing protein [Asaia astilbis]
MKRLALFLVATTACTPFLSAGAYAAAASATQEVDQKKADKTTALTKKNKFVTGSDESEQVVVTGTRESHVKARQSISCGRDLLQALERSGELNIANALTRTYPSITMSARGSNTNSLVSSVQMRGLGPNETLVLVDGKRRHSTANIVQKPGPQFASSGVDLNMLAGNMIDHIEVLEDGAAAMYGSDAIAGVVNIITKKKDHGLTLSGQGGANAYLAAVSSISSMPMAASSLARTVSSISAPSSIRPNTPLPGAPTTRFSATGLLAPIPRTTSLASSPGQKAGAAARPII